METKTSEGTLEEWLAKSRKLNPNCGCVQTGASWSLCAYHDGASDAWEDAWDEGYIQGANDHY